MLALIPLRSLLPQAGKQLVGRRIAVLRPADERFYTGQVTAYHARDRRHHVRASA